MKKRLLAMLLTLCMVLSLLPMTALAAPKETDVASIGDTGYATLAHAVADANTLTDATVTLLADVTLDGKLTISSNVTIEGAFTITRDAAYAGTLFEVSTGATLTLDGDLVIDGGNNWTYTEGTPKLDMANGAGTKVADHITPADGGVNATAHLIVNKGTLNANKVTIENSYSTNGVSAIDCGANSVTTIDGATIQKIAANRSGAIVYVGGNDAVLTIKGDTRITGNFGIGNGGIIQNYGQGTTVNMEGGKIDNNHVGKSGTLYASYSGNANKINTFHMSGGVITENIMEGYGPIYIHTNTVWNMTGGEISWNTSFLPNYARSNNNSGSISGGKIVNNEITGLNYSNGYYVERPDLYLNSKTPITGGTFTQDVTEYLTPDTGLVYDEETGIYSVNQDLYQANGKAYKTLAEAAKNLGSDNTVTVLCTHKMSAAAQIPENTTIILDLNGQTVTGSIAPFKGNLTIQNGSIVNPDKSVSAIEINDGELTLTDVNVSSARHAVRIDGDVTATINGGEYKATGSSGKTTHALNISGEADVTIKGGTFTGPAGTKSDSGAAVNVQSGAEVTIEGGTFTGGKNDTLANAGTLIVKGGTYDQDPTAYLAAGCEATEAEGMWTVEQDYVYWVKDQLLAGNSVTLDRDITITDYDLVNALKLPSNGNGKYDERHGNGAVFHVIEPGVVLDLNGHSITWDAHHDDYCNKRQVSLFMVTITGNENEPASLNIKDSIGTGKVDVYGMGTGLYVVGVDAKGTIEGGTWTNHPCKTCSASNIFMYPSHGGEMYITGGTFEQKESEYLLGWKGSTKETNNNGVGTDYDETKVEITGGTFVGFDPEEVKFFDTANSGQETIDGCAESYMSVKEEEGIWTVWKESPTVTFNTTPSDATVVVKLNNEVVAPSAENAKVYNLAQGETYTYTVTRNRYYSESGTFTVSGNEMTVTVDLNRKPAPPPVQDEDIPDPDIPLGDCDGGKDCPSNPYLDVDQSLWYHEGIDYAIVNNLMNGVADNLFAPNGTTNRAMIVTILYRLEGSPAAEAPTFSDVADDQWYTDAVGWAAANGIVTGYDEDTFGPLNPITREQMAAILYRYADSKGYDVSAGQNTNLLSFTDAETVSQYAIPAMQWAVGSDLINGVEGNALAPQGTASRAQVATILMRFCENVVK